MGMWCLAASRARQRACGPCTGQHALAGARRWSNPLADAHGWPRRVSSPPITAPRQPQLYCHLTFIAILHRFAAEAITAWGDLEVRYKRALFHAGQEAIDCLHIAALFVVKSGWFSKGQSASHHQKDSGPGRAGGCDLLVRKHTCEPSRPAAERPPPSPAERGGTPRRRCTGRARRRRAKAAGARDGARRGARRAARAGVRRAVGQERGGGVQGARRGPAGRPERGRGRGAALQVRIQ